MQELALKLARRQARRQARKKQRFFEDLKMVLQAVFLLTVGFTIVGAVIFLLGVTIAVLG